MQNHLFRFHSHATIRNNNILSTISRCQCVREFSKRLCKIQIYHCIVYLSSIHSRGLPGEKKNPKNNKSSFELELHLMFDKMYGKGQGLKWTRQVWMLNIGHLDFPPVTIYFIFGLLFFYIWLFVCYCFCVRKHWAFGLRSLVSSRVSFKRFQSERIQWLETLFPCVK